MAVATLLWPASYLDGTEIEIGLVKGLPELLNSVIKMPVGIMRLAL